MSFVLSGSKRGGTGGGAPSGPAGGDLSGTYPNPLVSSVQTDAVDTAGIQDDAVTQDKIAAGAVGRTELASGIGALDLIEDILLGGATASFDFQNIPATYRHLKLFGRLKGTNATNSVECQLRLNNISTGSYYTSRMTCIGAVTAAQQSGATYMYLSDVPAASEAGANGAVTEITIPGYLDESIGAASVLAQTTTYIGASGGGRITHFGGLGPSADITRITIFPSAGNWAAGCRMTLYGVV